MVLCKVLISGAGSNPAQPHRTVWWDQREILQRVLGEGMVKSMRTKATGTELLGRVIAPLGRCLTPSSAKTILCLKADTRARRRVQNLAAKCGAGTLTPDETAEYRLLVQVGDLVALLQAKARRFLAEHPAK
jgi:hypothetical protein